MNHHTCIRSVDFSQFVDYASAAVEIHPSQAGSWNTLRYLMPRDPDCLACVRELGRERIRLALESVFDDCLLEGLTPALEHRRRENAAEGRRRIRLLRRR